MMRRSPLLAVVLGLGFVAMLVILNRTPAPAETPWWDNFFIGAIGSVVGGAWLLRQYRNGNAGWMNILCGVGASVAVLLIILGVIRGL